MILSANEIAGLIYWSGNFGPNFGLDNATQGPSGNIIHQIPAPGTPSRVRDETWLDTAIAICLAESSGNTQATNGNAQGLWQIMVSVHQSEVHDALLYWETELANGKKLTILDPRVNTYAAGLVWQKQGFNAWRTYTNGSYKKFTGHGKSAYAFLTSPTNLAALRQRLKSNLANDQATETFVGGIFRGTSLATGNVSPSSILSGVLGFLNSAGIAVGVFLLALVLLLVGAWILISNSKSGKQAIGLASKLPI